MSLLTKGFAFVGSQYALEVGGEDFKLDQKAHFQFPFASILRKGEEIEVVRILQHLLPAARVLIEELSA